MSHFYAKTVSHMDQNSASGHNPALGSAGHTITIQGRPFPASDSLLHLHRLPNLHEQAPFLSMRGPHTQLTDTLLPQELYPKDPSHSSANTSTSMPFQFTPTTSSKQSLPIHPAHSPEDLAHRQSGNLLHLQEPVYPHIYQVQQQHINIQQQLQHYAQHQHYTGFDYTQQSQPIQHNPLLQKLAEQPGLQRDPVQKLAEQTESHHDPTRQLAKQPNMQTPAQLQRHFMRYLQQSPQVPIPLSSVHHRMESGHKFPAETNQQALGISRQVLLPPSSGQKPGIDHNQHESSTFLRQLEYQSSSHGGALAVPLVTSRKQMTCGHNIVADNNATHVQAPISNLPATNQDTATSSEQVYKEAHGSANHAVQNSADTAQRATDHGSPHAPLRTDTKRRGRPKKYILDPSTNEYIGLDHPNFKALNKILKESAIAATNQHEKSTSPVPQVAESQALSSLLSQPVRKRHLDDEGVKQLLKKKDKRGRPRKFPIEQTGTTIQGIRVNGSVKNRTKKQKTK